MMLSPKQLHELIDGHPSIRDDTAERTKSDLLVIGNDGSAVGHDTAQDHVASSLASKDESRPLQCGANFTS